MINKNTLKFLKDLKLNNSKEWLDENQASEFLRMKGFYTMEKLTDKEIISIDTFNKINSYFKTTKPLADFLNRAIEND
jgi:uncharacterized protein (DUF2461 family)